MNVEKAIFGIKKPITMNIRLFVTSAALCIGLAASAQPSEWNVQYIKHKGYGYPCAMNPRKIDIPDIDGYTTLKVDFHMHTINSDGLVAPSMRVTEAFVEGLDAIAITDHQPAFGKPKDWDYDQSYKQAAKEAKSRDILLIRGMEMSHNQNEIGHMNVLFIKDCNDYRIPQAFGLKEAHEVLVQAQKEGAWVTGNHPGWPDQNSELGQFWTEEIEAGRIQGMEVFNAYEFYPLAIDHIKKYNLAFIGASDEHRPMNFTYDLPNVMRPMTLVFATERSVEGIHEALKARRSVAYANNMLAGDTRWLLKLFKASLKIEKVEDRGANVRVRIFNQSDIDYLLDCGNPAKQIIIPAHRYFDDERPKIDMGLQYNVTNMFVSSTECLSVPMKMLFTRQSDIDMPFLDEKGVTCSDGTVTLPLICEEGETYYTTDGSEPTPGNGTLCTGPVSLTGTCTLKARTFRGDKSSFTFEYPLTFLASTKVKGKKNGLSYSFFSDPAERSIISVDDLTPERFRMTGTTAVPSLQKHEEQDWYGYIFEGWLKAPVSGVYTFKLDTDDGSQLFLDDCKVIDNNYNKGNIISTGYVYLEEGMHKFRMPYFEGHYDEKIELGWMVPGCRTFSPVPAENFYLAK